MNVCSNPYLHGKIIVANIQHICAATLNTFSLRWSFKTYVEKCYGKILRIFLWPLHVPSTFAIDMLQWLQEICRNICCRYAAKFLGNLQHIFETSKLFWFVWSEKSNTVPYGYWLFCCFSSFFITNIQFEIQILTNIIYYAPFVERGISWHPSVGLSVDQVMSARYLFTPFLESCHSWYSGCP